jgi:hypothetical protein
MMVHILSLAVCTFGVVSAMINQIKLSQGMEPDSMVITWSSGAVSENSQVQYGTSSTNLEMLAEGGDGM